jgi:hypothetical protein
MTGVAATTVAAMASAAAAAEARPNLAKLVRIVLNLLYATGVPAIRAAPSDQSLVWRDFGRFATPTHRDRCNETHLHGVLPQTGSEMWKNRAGQRARLVFVPTSV